MDKGTKVKRAMAFYAPMVLYLGFIIIFLVTRFIFIFLITGNAYLNPQHLPRQYNLVPFATITTYINPENQRFLFLDVIGNILLFVPMGIYIHALSRKKKIWLSAIFSLLSTLIIESAQFALATGSFDIDDVLMNFIGAFSGVLIYHLIYCICKKDADTSKLVLSTISVTVIPLLFATALQYFMWVPVTTLVPVCLAAFAASYTVLYFLLYHREKKPIQILYGTSCIALCLHFFIFIMPMVSPSA